MKKNLTDQFKVAYERFKGTEHYQQRVKQSILTPLFSEIILETLKNDPLLNKHLTGLIQMFKYNCQPKSFENYLNTNVLDVDRRVEFLHQFKQSGYTGYTGAGLSSVTGLSAIQLHEVKVFLLKAYDISAEDEAMRLCAQFEQLNIPKVRAGIYSPWLHYINPKLFPLSNNSHKTFRNWIGMPPDYPSCIRDFNHLARIVGENDLGCIDFCAHLMEIDTEKPKQIETSGHKIFKISMSPATNEVDHKTFEYCLANNIIIMGGSTKAIGTSKVSQNELFRNVMKIGDYFYLCRGNEGVILIGQITGDSSEFSLESFMHKHWIKRPYEIIAKNQDKSTPYKKEKKHWTPNFNSTFTRIPENEIAMANDLIFKPYFKTEFKTQSEGDHPKKPLTPPLNLILYGPPGTGKTYHTINEALKIINPDFDLDQEREIVRKEYDKFVKEGRIVFATFHQSMSYEDFVEGIKPVDPGIDEGQVVYRIQNGIFKRLSLQASEVTVVNNFDDAYQQFINDLTESGGIKLKTPVHRKEFNVTINSRGSCIAQPTTDQATSMTIPADSIRKVVETGTGKDWSSYAIPIGHYLKEKYNLSVQPVDNSSKPFILIIDEINRGNVSQIFGELITLIEPDKRAGATEALEVTLPYSKKIFSVPSNLFIIGTMNTADRSVEAIDTALRRRFIFREMMPDYNAPGMDKEIEGIPLNGLLSVINQRIEVLLDRDHQIGHSFLMHVEDMAGLMSAFYNSIIPLLKEYFYGDFGKIGLVLESGFVVEEKESKNVFSDFPYMDKSLLAEKKIYRIHDFRKTGDAAAFSQALKLLMGQSSNEAENEY